MRLQLVFFVVALTALPHPSVAADSEASGRHFRVHCHFKNDAVAAEVLETAEAAWKTATKLFGASGQPVDEPMSVHLYPDVEAYREAEGRLAGGEFRNEPGFAHPDSHAIHVLVQPPLSKRLLKTVGLPAMTRRRVAREVAHLARFTAIPNFGSHPGWLGDGAAIYVAARVMRSNKWSPSSASDPFMATHMSCAKKMLEDQRLPPMSSIFQDSLQSLKSFERDALRWSLFRFLRKRENAPKLDQVIAEAGRIEPGIGYPQGLYVFAEQTFGRDGFERLNTDFREFVRGLKPKWEVKYHSLEVRRKQWIQIAFPDNNALAWRSEPTGSEKFTIQGELKILQAKVEQMNVIFGRDENGFVSAVFTGKGGVGVMLYNRRNKNWKTLASGKSALLKPGKKTRFQVTVKNDRVEVYVGKRLVTKVELTGHDFSGPWAVGVQAGAAGVWYGVRLSD